MLSQFALLYITLAPPLVSAGTLFAEDSLVKMLNPDSFKSALEPNTTSMIAFVSSSNSDCQHMVSDYEKAALGLHPSVPTYAVDCDNERNKGLCRDQGVEKFPVIKLFPRGRTEPSLIFEDSNERSASSYYYWASRSIPNYVTKLYKVEDIQPWTEKTRDKDAILLLTKEKKIPQLWRVLANKYLGQLELSSHRDRRGRSSVKLGMEAGGKNEAKVLVYPAGSTEPFRYEGINKMDSLSRFFDSIIDGTVDLKTANEKAMAEEFVPDEKELEIERKQEAQRLALAHGGFADFIDFEKAIKEGHGANYHDINGYPGMMGELPTKKKSKSGEEEEGHIFDEGTFAKESPFRVPDEL